MGNNQENSLALSRTEEEAKADRLFTKNFIKEHFETVKKEFLNDVRNYREKQENIAA